jgi:branched-chain amino acid transport system ATP-binding protein
MAGMTVDEKEDMSAFILASRDALDNTVVLIEHDMGVVMDLAEHVVVLDFGRKIGDGTPAEVRRNEAVVTAYLGADSAPAGALEEAR